VKMEVADHWIHPDWYRPTIDNDIALIKFRDRVTYSPTLQPVCLGDDSFQLHATAVECYISGWGHLQYDGSTPTVLRHVAVRPIESSRCSSDVFNSTMICVGHLNGQVAACNGDSGGPLVCRNDQDRWVLTGVASWGEFCQGFTVYARVSAFLDTFVYPTMENNP